MSSKTETEFSKAVDHWVNKVIPALETKLVKNYKRGNTRRFFHTKMHGLLKAEFIIEPDLPKELKVGIFAMEKTYPAWIRFSTAHQSERSDKKKTTFGMGIKLMDVPGEKNLESQKNAQTQDFVLDGVPVLNAKSFQNAGEAILAVVSNIFVKLWFVIRHIPELIKALKPTPNKNTLYSQFWSLTPYAFGEDQVIKFSVVPRNTNDPGTHAHDGPDYVRLQMVSDLSKEDWWYDFVIQFREDPEKMSITDPSQEWKSEFHKVASIRIPKQEFDTEIIRLFGENLSFNPWHSLPEHIPLGKINEARKQVYETLSKFRHSRNDMEVFEPTSDTKPEDVLRKKIKPTEVENLFIQGEKTYQSQFTTIIPIENGQNEKLHKELIDLKKRQDQVFSKLRTVHFCRFFIIDQKINNDETFSEHPHLTFSAVFDGELDYFLDELFEECSEDMYKIFGKCEKYPESGRDAVIGWLKGYRNKEKLFWAAKKGATVSTIRREEDLQKRIQDYLNQMYEKEDLKAFSPRELYNRILDFVKSKEHLKWALIPEPPTAFSTKVKDELNKIFVIVTIGILLIPLLVIWTPLTILFNTIDRKKYKDPELKSLESVLNYEDNFYQNQLTIYAIIKSPGWFRRTNLKLFLFVANNSMRYRATKGSLGGITSIHFVSWGMFNNNKNGMFLSNYDNGWQSYLSEFIDKAANIMNRSFGNLQGYPPIRGLNKDGAYDEQKFKEIVRQYQFPCPVWYSAYPHLSVSNVLFNSKIRQGLSGNPTDAEIKEWLQLF